MSEQVAVGIDVGGTKVQGLLVDVSNGRVLARSFRETPTVAAEETAAAVIGAARELLEDERVPVGIGAAGMVDRRGVVRFSPNLPWRDLPLRDLVAEQLDRDVVVDNDATTATWGEVRFGVARGRRHVLLVTVGTGIGGGIVCDGVLMRGANGFAGEIGHVIVEPGGPECGCGNRGCWEQVASGRAIDRLGREAGERHPDAAFVRMAGGDVRNVLGAMVTAAAREGDAVAVDVLRSVGRRLGEGIAGLVNVLDPEVVVVGGGVIDAGDLLLEPAREAYWDTVEGASRRPPVPLLPAALGPDAGAIGAADLAARAAA